MVFDVAVAIDNNLRAFREHALLLQQNHFVCITAIYQWAHFPDRGQLPMFIIEMGEFGRQVRPQLGECLWQVILMRLRELQQGGINVPKFAHASF